MTTAERTPWTVAIEPDPIRPADYELAETPDLDRLTAALADPNAEQVLYRVTYRRVGRRGGRDGSTPPPPLTAWAMTADDLAEQVHRDIRHGNARGNATGNPLLGRAYLHRSRMPLDQAPIDRVTPHEWAKRQTDIFGQIADAELEDGDPDGCSPWSCRSGRAA